jgi:hypothetical protein
VKVSSVWQESLIPTLFDWSIILIYLIIILIFAYFHQKKNLEKNPIYKYFLPGLFFKIFLGIGFCLVYTFYYGGGDTTGYFRSSEACINLIFKGNFNNYLSLLIGNRTLENWCSFDGSTSFPDYFRDAQAFSVVRFTSVFSFFAFMNYFTTTILLDTFAFLGIWKLYMVFTYMYPQYYKRLAIGLLFIPSIVFWGSGILKDCYTLSATGWLTYNIYMIFIKRKKVFANILIIIINCYIILSLKPYIIVALLPGIFMWAFYDRTQKIGNKFIRTLIGPGVVLLSFSLGVLSLSLFGEKLGAYTDIKSISEKAQIVQQDLTKGEQYGKNFYDIGKFDASLTGILGKAPISILTALFRPFIWEARNPVMILSGLENTLVLMAFLYIMFKVGLMRMLKIVGNEPLLFFSFLFAIIFAFSIGLASANFGALVRYRIPCMIFFIPSLIILYERMKEIRDTSLNGEIIA